MSCRIFTDSSCNLSAGNLGKYHISCVPFSYSVNGEEHLAEGFFNGEEYYKSLRAGATASTSLVNQNRFEEAFEPALAAGDDVLFVGMSSGISGAYRNSQLAAQSLSSRYPERKIVTVDTLSASLGEGLLVIMAAELLAAGKDIDDIASALREKAIGVNQLFTVGDLAFLKRGGRVSGVTAAIGTVLNIKPLLKGDREGKIKIFSKSIGRITALKKLASLCAENIIEPENQTVYIAHCGCSDDADFLAEAIKSKVSPKDFMIEIYEPVTGAHVGPDTVALFFLGKSCRD